MSLFRKSSPAKTAEQCIKEIMALGTDTRAFTRIFGLSQVNYLKGYSWQKLDHKTLLASPDLYPLVARIYEAQKSLDGGDTEKEKLIEENKRLKKKVTELTAEVERLSQPTGRKILVDQKETA